MRGRKPYPLPCTHHYELKWRCGGCVPLTRHHDGADVGGSQLTDDGRRLRLQRVLHHEETEEAEFTLHRRPDPQHTEQGLPHRARSTTQSKVYHTEQGLPHRARSTTQSKVYHTEQGLPHRARSTTQSKVYHTEQGLPHRARSTTQSKVYHP